MSGNLSKAPSPKICERGGDADGIFFPAGGDAEADLPDVVKVIIYGCALAWCFMGVSIVADIFMSAIETITSKKKRVYDKEKQRYKTIKVWNETVANLTLMALGSSAPEILLNVVEVGKREFFAGDLGPGTIVGSAAFNLLVISAVCVVAIPSDQHPNFRLIKDTTVYVVTAGFSLFAYFWIIIVLQFSSKDVVSLWEAILTFFMFPILLMISFAADKGWITGIPAIANRRGVVAAEMTKEELAEMVSHIKEEFGDIDDASIAILVEKATAARPSRAVYRAERRKLKAKPSTSWGSIIVNTVSDGSQDIGARFGHVLSGLRGSSSGATIVPEGQSTLEFATSNYAVKESAKFAVAEVQRNDNTRSKVTVRYRTKEGTASPGKDYVHVEGKLDFLPGEKIKKVPVKILDDDAWEQAEDFYIELYDEVCDSGTVVLGQNKFTTITIIDDDDPGCLSFETDFISHASTDGLEVVLKIIRKHGAKGEISCQYATEDDSAVAPLDYEAQEGTLTLKDGEMSSTITILLMPRGRYDHTERFRLILSEPAGNCRFDQTGDGDGSTLTCTIELKASTEHKAMVDKLAQTLSVNWDKAKLGKENWYSQFVGAFYVGGSAEEQAEARPLDWFFHILQLPWKVIFATVPPPEFAGGWCCFFVALAWVGIVTAVIGDLAALFGCSLSLPPQITAITFVALGTSLPDTFASKTAATQDPYADASITNITGSNSVNVFLGLGLPWVAASLFWAANGQSEDWRQKTPQSIKDEYGDSAAYVLPADDLGFSVCIFSACALLAIGALWMRRKLFRGELGGPFAPKVISALYLVFLWIVYVAASWLYIEVNKDD